MVQTATTILHGVIMKNKNSYVIKFKASSNIAKYFLKKVEFTNTKMRNEEFIQ